MIATVLKKREGSRSVQTIADLDAEGLKVMDPPDPEHSWKIFRKWSTVPCIYVVMDPCDDTLEDPLLRGNGDGVASNKLCHLIPGLRAVLPMPSRQKLGRIT